MFERKYNGWHFSVFSLTPPRSVSLSLFVAYVCKNCHTMTLIRGFGTPLQLLSSPRLCSALPAPGLNGGDISFIIIAAFYYTDLFHRAKKEGRKEGRKEGGREGNIAFGTEISCRLCQNCSSSSIMPPLQLTASKGEVNKAGPRLHELLEPWTRNHRNLGPALSNIPVLTRMTG